MPSKPKDLPKLKSLEQFLFEIPLYEPFEICLEDGHIPLLFRYGEQPAPVDGHCPACGRQSTFNISRSNMFPTNCSQEDLMAARGYYEMKIGCVRDKSHFFAYHFRKEGPEIQKLVSFLLLRT